MVIIKKSPTFSIILPTHNRADVLPYSIDSVLQQTFKDFELLIIGDGCTDDTEKVIRSYVKKDKRVRWFPFSKGKGFGYEHRNTVLIKAIGKYIAFAAHDDIWFSDHLESFADYFNSIPKIEIALSRPLWVDPDGTILPSCFNPLSPSMKQSFQNVQNEVPAICVVHTRLSAEKVELMDVNLPEGGDWDLWCRLLKKGDNKSIGFISFPTTLHFRANWRKKRFYRDIYLDRMHEIINGNLFYKKSLHIKSITSEPLQKALWKLVNTLGWMSYLRFTASAILDDQVRLGLVISASKKTKIKYIQKLENDLSRIMSTKGYKALNVVRKILRLRS